MRALISAAVDTFFFYYSPPWRDFVKIQSDLLASVKSKDGISLASPMARWPPLFLPSFFPRIAVKRIAVAPRLTISIGAR